MPDLKTVTLRVWQLGWSAKDLEPDGTPYGSKAEAEAASVAAARERLGNYEAAADLFEEIAGTGLLGAERLEELEGMGTLGKLLAALNEAETLDLARALDGFTFAIYASYIKLPLGDVCDALVNQCTPLKAFLSEALELRASAVTWDDLDDEERDIRKRGFDNAALALSDAGARLSLAREPEPLCLLDIRAGDLVDLKGAPGCEGEEFQSATFELFTVIEAERTDEATVCLGFEGVGGLHAFEAAGDLPVIRCGAYWPDTEIKAPT